MAPVMFNRTGLGANFRGGGMLGRKQGEAINLQVGVKIFKTFGTPYLDPKIPLDPLIWYLGPQGPLIWHLAS